jgi:hypothetical protein
VTITASARVFCAAATSDSAVSSPALLKL